MSAHEHYQDHPPRLQSPPTDANETSGDHDHYNATDVDEQTGAQERVTSPHRLGTLLSSSHERPHSGYSQVSGNEEPNDEEGGNLYGKNYNMPNEESKEALVPPVRRRRSSGYQDLGACFPGIPLTY